MPFPLQKEKLRLKLIPKIGILDQLAGSVQKESVGSCPGAKSIYTNVFVRMSFPFCELYSPSEVSFCDFGKM